MKIHRTEYRLVPKPTDILGNPLENHYTLHRVERDKDNNPTLSKSQKSGTPDEIAKFLKAIHPKAVGVDNIVMAEIENGIE